MKIGNISFEKSVGAVIFRQAGGERKFLLLKYRSGHWDFPKGHVEEGENEEDTLRREVLEETGIKEMDMLSGFRKSIFYSYKPKGKEGKAKIGINLIIKRVVYYICETKESEIVISDEHRGYDWIATESTLERITHKNGKMIFTAARIFFKEN